MTGADDVTGASVTLPSGVLAAITPDPLQPGAFELALDGVVQSHVDLGDPTSLRHDYLARMAAVTERVLPDGPLRVLHLGGGALTLARQLQVVRAGSRQTVAEKEEGLIGFVTAQLPMPLGTDLTERTGDAAVTVGALHGSFDLIVCDLYQGLVTPEGVRDEAFYREVARRLAPGGAVLVNVADDEEHPALQQQLMVLREVFGGVLLLAPEPVLARAEAGNVVVLATADPLPPATVDSLRGAGPHPAAVVDASLLDASTSTTPRKDT